MDFFNQSVLLYLSYYWVQILVHKPFITRPNADSDLSFPSLAICVNAARSAIHVMEVQQRRGFLPLPNVVVRLLFVLRGHLLFLFSIIQDYPL